MRKRLTQSMLIPYISSAFIILSLFLQPLSEFFNGYGRILVSKSILLTDYVAVGGMGPALFNSGSLMLITYFFIRKLDLRITGSIFAGIMTIGGFAFFGKIEWQRYENIGNTARKWESKNSCIKNIPFCRNGSGAP